ncbi:uncharacterized protein V6R79_011698 [Siganus canaliculatus]
MSASACLSRFFLYARLARAKQTQDWTLNRTRATCGYASILQYISRPSNNWNKFQKWRNSQTLSSLQFLESIDSGIITIIIIIIIFTLAKADRGRRQWKQTRQQATRCTLAAFKSVQERESGFSHDTVTAVAERTERQRELEVSLQNIQQRIQDRESDVKLLQQEVEAINASADKAVEDSETVFSELIQQMEKRRRDVKQQVRSQQEAEMLNVIQHFYKSSS